MVYKKRPTTRRGKRDFAASANLGAFGKYSVSYTKRNLATTVKNIVRRGLETPQHFVTLDTINNTALTHNTLYCWNPIVGIAQGTAYGNRIGDEIHVDSIKVNSLLTCNVTSPQIYRLMLVKSTKQYNVPNWGSALGTNNLFIGGTGAGITPCGILDPKLCTLVWEKEFKLIPSIASQVNYTCIRETIHIDQKFVYQTNSNFGKNNNYYFVLVGYVDGGVTGTTSVGKIVTNSDLIFKNTQ